MGQSSDIVVISHGRFHSFDLAEQLEAAGRLAAIYTGYPRFKLRNSAVRPELIRSFPYFVVPSMALTRFPWLPAGPLRELAWRGGEALTRHAGRTLPECGLVTALSGSGREAGREIKRRGGVYICDRGSPHIRWSADNMTAEYDRLGMRGPKIDVRTLENEEIEYDLADAITVPSAFARRSFIAMGIPEDRLHVLPYGVNLERFRRVAPRAAKFRILFVGQLCVRKGLHDLLEAFARLRLPDAELVLVGPATVDTAHLLARYPLDNVVLAGQQSRDGVAREMSRASVLALPSLEEGLALVLAQAMACGCPVIASTQSGAEDLYDDGEEGFIVAPRDSDALCERFLRLYDDRDLVEAMADKAHRRVAGFGGWDRYGKASLSLFDGLMRASALGLAPVK